MEATTTEAVKTGLTAASVLNNIRNNRIEYLLLSLLAYSVGALDTVGTHVTGLCL